jgi:Scramblase.
MQSHYLTATSHILFSFIAVVFYVIKNMEVSSPPGTVIGSIQQEWSILTPQFNIKNAAGDTVLKIEGPICTFSICGDVEFKVGFFFLCFCLMDCSLFYSQGVLKESISDHRLSF